MSEKQETNKIYKHPVLRVVIFCVLALGLIFYLFLVFGLHDEKNAEGMFDEFYDQREDSIDVVWLGASAVNAYYSPIQAYEEYGVTSFDLSSSQEPLMLTETLIDETLKTQTPKLFVIEVRNIKKNDDEILEPACRRVTDGMHFSVNRMKAVKTSLDFMKKSGTPISYEWSYYIPFGKYHARWNGDLQKSDFVYAGRMTSFKGFRYSPDSSTNIHPIDSLCVTDKTMPADKNQTASFKSLLNRCAGLKDDGIEVMFIFAPHNTGENAIAECNWALKLAEKRGFTCLDFNDSEDDIKNLDINTQTDFMDLHHVNILGMKKYTSYVTKFIVKKYNLEDHRGDSDYSDWNKSVKEYHEFMDPKYKEMERKL